jgi:hypothetical protein
MKIIRSEDLNLWEKEKERAREQYHKHIEARRAYQRKWAKEHYNPVANRKRCKKYKKHRVIR